MHCLYELLLGGFKQNSTQGGGVFTRGNIFALNLPRKDISSKELNSVHTQMHFPFNMLQGGVFSQAKKVGKN